MVEEDGPGFWTVMLYTWPYLCIPVAFAVDGRLRAKWVLEDVSRPATGYRFKGANVQMVFTARAQGPERLLGQNSGATSSEGRQEHGRSRWLDCTNLWYLSVVIPAVFVCAAEWSSGAASVFLLCTPFVFLAVFSLTLSQVCEPGFAAAELFPSSVCTAAVAILSIHHPCPMCRCCAPGISAREAR